MCFVQKKEKKKIVFLLSKTKNIVELCVVLVILLFLTMMQRWNRRRGHSPIVACVLVSFIVCSIIYNESSIQKIHDNPRQLHRKSTVQYIKPNLGNHFGDSSGMFGFLEVIET